MAWIWSDELAEAAESAGLKHRDIAAWRRRPVAFAVRPDEQPESLARQMLGFTPTESREACDDQVDVVAPISCSCGGQGILAQRTADG